MYIYTQEYTCTHDDTPVTTKNIAAVRPSYLNPNAIGNSDIKSQFHSSMYKAVSKLTKKNSSIEIANALHILITLSNILP